MSARTVRDFAATTDVAPIVEAWARETGYRFVETRDSARVYQKGSGFLVAPMMLSISQAGDKVHLETWIRANLLVRLFALFLLPAEMGIESGGFKGALPRTIARGAVNKLLDRLGQPPIP